MNTHPHGDIDPELAAAAAATDKVNLVVLDLVRGMEIE